MLPAAPSFSLKGRRAIVTGAGRGLGAGIAAALAQAGAAVTLVARSEHEIKAVAEAIQTRGDHAEAVMLDVLDGEAVRRFFSENAAFDVLVNNAGTNRPKSITEVSEADYDAVLGLNLRSAFFVAQAAARRMIDAKLRGSVIHVGSQMGHVGGRNRTLYCASKWGLEGMSKAMALDVAPYGIRSNTIAPTFIETPMTARSLEDAAFRAEVLGKIKLGRLGRVEDLLGAIIYLASEASALVTGTSLVIDGGWTAD